VVESAQTVGSASATSASRGRRHLSLALVSLGLVLLLVTMALAILLAQEASRSRLRSTFHLRALSSATFVSTYLFQQARREQQTARTFFSGRVVPPGRFPLVVSAFGSRAAVLLDSSGRLLNVVPADRALLGRQLAVHYAHLRAAEQGQIAVSDVVRSAVRKSPVTAIAVPFSTPYGRRVFSAAYPVARATLGAFVDHAIPYREHEVYLVDGNGRLLAASPSSQASTLVGADPSLAKTMAGKTAGTLPGARVPSTFTVASVPSTSWKLVIAVPDSRLYASVQGWNERLPWIVFGLVSAFGALAVALLSRSLADRRRLAMLSRELQRAAHTDAVTGLANRRALSERLLYSMIQARRQDEPFSVLMIDLDCFKRINDTFGHDAGDRVLRAVARCLESVLRVSDVYGRWGGDEFLVALPDTDEDGAEVAAERLLEAAREVSLAEVGLDHGIPLSIGVASGTYTTPDELIAKADLALYQSKAQGRGRITIAASRSAHAA
jgi:diguanylate cyclase (GGDEF)-like protein